MLSKVKLSLITGVCVFLAGCGWHQDRDIDIQKRADGCTCRQDRDIDIQKREIVEMFNKHIIENFILVTPGSSTSTRMEKIRAEDVVLSGSASAWKVSFPIPIEKKKTPLIQARGTIERGALPDRYIMTVETLSKLPFRNTNVFYQLRSQHVLDKHGNNILGSRDLSFMTTLLDEKLRPVLTFCSEASPAGDDKKGEILLKYKRSVVFSQHVEDFIKGKTGSALKFKKITSKLMGNTPYYWHFFHPFCGRGSHPLGIHVEKTLQWAPKESLPFLNMFFRKTK